MTRWSAPCNTTVSCERRGYDKPELKLTGSSTSGRTHLNLAAQFLPFCEVVLQLLPEDLGRTGTGPQAHIAQTLRHFGHLSHLVEGIVQLFDEIRCHASRPHQRVEGV